MPERYLDYPFAIDARGRVKEAGEDDHIRDLIHQVLFTSPGERVNRPDFGCGLMDLVFMPASDALAAATQFQVQGALQRWLGHRIQVERVQVTVDDATLTVDITYARRGSGERRQEQFTAPATGA